MAKSDGVIKSHCPNLFCLVCFSETRKTDKAEKSHYPNSNYFVWTEQKPSNEKTWLERSQWYVERACQTDKELMITGTEIKEHTYLDNKTNYGKISIVHWTAIHEKKTTEVSEVTTETSLVPSVTTYYRLYNFFYTIIEYLPEPCMFYLGDTTTERNTQNGLEKGM